MQFIKVGVINSSCTKNYFGNVVKVTQIISIPEKNAIISNASRRRELMLDYYEKQKNQLNPDKII